MFKSKNYFKNINQYYKKNYLVILTLVLISFFISYLTFKDYVRGLITIFLSTLFLWIGHFSIHYLNNNILISYLHYVNHHGDYSKTLLGNITESFFIELFFFGTGFLFLLTLIIKSIWKVYILNPYIIIFWTVSYIAIHFLSHHNKELNKQHSYHHKNSSTTFSPEYWDVVFKTKDENQEIYFEYIIIPIIILISLIVAISIKSPIDFLQ